MLSDAVIWVPNGCPLGDHKTMSSQENPLGRSIAPRRGGGVH